MGWVDPWVRLGWVELGWIGLGWVEIFRFLVCWVVSWVRNIYKILKLGRPLVAAEVIPDNLIMIMLINE